MHYLTDTENTANNSAKNKKHDPALDLVGRGIAEWRTARPDLDSSGKEIIGRIIRLEGIVLKLVEEALQPFELSYFEYAVLATLRVANEANSLRPNNLMARLLCSSGGLSNMLKRLESRGFIERSASPDDGRMVLVKLTHSGVLLADQVMPVHAQTELKLVSMLNSSERKVLTNLLSRVMVGNAPELMQPELAGRT